MTTAFEVRPGKLSDTAAIEAIYTAAFPEESLVPLLRQLLQCGDRVLSLVATADGEVIGHVIFTKATTRTATAQSADLEVALLGPLAVAPAWQKRGVGSMLVRDGLQRLRQNAVHQVFVLGDPGYYSRFGFTQEARVATPYPLPAEWETGWQSIELDTRPAPAGATICLPQPWMRRELWLP